MADRRGLSRTWGRLASAVVFASAVAGVAAFFGLGKQPDRPQVASHLAESPHEIIPGGKLYYLGSDTSYGFTAAYAIDTEEGIIVIDPGLRFEVLRHAFDTLGLDVSRVEIVLVTHRHADHWFAARELRDKTGAKVMAHPEEAKWLTRAGDLRQYYSIHAMPLPQVPTLSDVYPLQDGDVVRRGDATIHVLATPGHTPGSLCFQTTIRGYRVLFSGDTVMTLSPDARNGDYMARIGRQFGRDARAYLTVSIGCTGGRHRSVYLVERLARVFAGRYQVLIRHRELH